jgi:S-adenosylmethionine synthetase
MSLARVKGPGEPDQACDLVAAAIVEEYARRDPNAKLDIRVSGGRGVVFVVGDVSSTADFDVSAVVRRTLGQCGISSNFEPFISLEPMLPTWAVSLGVREMVSAFGYATSETEDRLPKAVGMARTLARELEHRRTLEADWFWLGSDYQVVVDLHQKQPLVLIRVEHLETQALDQVRKQVRDALAAKFPSLDIRINTAGEESKAGLAQRVGSSRRSSGLDAYGSQLPFPGSGVGHQASHPLNIGNWLARSVARELVQGGKGKAITVHVAWLPLEARPRSIKVRNEKGEDLSTLVDPTRFDLSHLPEAYLAPTLGTLQIRSTFDAGVTLPWETGNLPSL